MQEKTTAQLDPIESLEDIDFLVADNSPSGGGTGIITKADLFAGFSGAVSLPMFDVTSAPYNATGDGVTDDTAAFESAYADLVAAGGGMIFVPTGTFIVDGLIHVTSNFTFAGVGQDSIIKLKANANTDTICDGNAVTAQEYVHYINFAIDGNKSNQPADKPVTPASAERCGLRLRHDAQNTYYVTVENIYAYNTRQNGISVESTNGCTVSQCRSEYNDVYGIWWENGNNVNLTNNYTSHNGSGGIKVFNAGDGSVMGNQSKSDKGSGMALQAVGRISVIGNKLFRAGWRYDGATDINSNGMSISDADDCQFIGNTIYGSQGHGIDMQGINRSVFIGNNFKFNGQYTDNTYDDIYMNGSACTDNAFIGNSFNNTTNGAYPNVAKYNLESTSTTTHNSNKLSNNLWGTPATARYLNLPEATRSIIDDFTATGAASGLHGADPEFFIKTTGDENKSRIKRTAASGNVTFYNVVDGAIGTPHSLVSDGVDDYVRIPHASDLNVSAAFTLSAWVKLTTLTNNPRILNKNYTLTVLSTGKLRCTLPGVVDISDTGSTLVTTGTWVHIAVTHSGTSYKFYVGGTLNSTITNANNPGSATGDFFIGDTGTNRINGLSDDHRLYARELSGAEITTLSTGGDPSTTNLIGHWKVNESSGTTTADASGNGHTGTLTGGGTFSTDVPAANPGTSTEDSEIVVFSSQDGSNGETGIQTFGNSTGKTTIEGDSINLASDKLAFYDASPIEKQTGDVATALVALGLVSSATYGTSANVSTTDATLTTLATIAIPTTTTVMIEARVVARRTGGASGTAEDAAAYIITACYKNVAGTATEVGEASIFSAEDQAGWACTVNPSSGNALIQVTGAASNNISWVTTYRTYTVGT